MRIRLNAGHGAGKEHNRGGVLFNEGDNNFHYSLVLKAELETYENVKVDLVRNKITDNPSLAQRAKMGQGYDLYLAIHSNAASDSSVRGTEVWDSVERPNKQLAQLLCDTTAIFFNHRNRGVKYKEGKTGYNWYGELRFNQAKSSMIIENGFHTNREDSLIFRDKQKELAVVQARTIASFYNLKKKAIKEDKPHWAQKHYDSLKAKGMEIQETRFDDKITRGEVFALLDRITNYKEVK
ncbi:N-acetylmuramoyl-L-alanine amidase family protein [Sporanaerobacter acetigenes]|uniref:N-acetylmuramoyl-L-alanine amidase n=1 Tax=Sporanaerobacter acetigenes DSM 13106 TaxID=1123281 RepID=A0A1M5TYG9_9FIRM|nr:N-acetylmuramoyl-L-alanine amidase [Sporanaerobacter acetigenes]SHH55650.1 N-acetylmuramoyl-L-alanine amidase [Sporanaerobacter acetigenes DSM 13106]